MTDFRMSQHDVDQRAAALRDSGIPAPTVKIIATCIAQSMGQAGDFLNALDKLGITLTTAETADMLHDFAHAWEQLRDTL